jgi:thymidine kinase
VIPFLPARGGSLDVICGPMFSGKSEELLRRVRRAEIAQLAPLLVKPSLDDRYGEADVVSHAGSRLRCVSIGSSGDIEGHPDLAAALVVAIDEVQFLDDGVVEVALGLVRRGIRVLAAGLDRDFRGEPFGPMPQLLAHADDADKLHAICQICAGPATMTQRLVDGRPARRDDPVILVGASESYEARCRGCHRIADAVLPLVATG